MKTYELISKESIKQLKVWVNNFNKPVVLQTHAPENLLNILFEYLGVSVHKFVQIRTEHGSKNIAINQITEVKQISKSRSSNKEMIIFFIVEAEKMSIEAQNSLLKLLEEPPKGVGFALITGDRTKLLPTIVSRSQVINVLAASKDTFIDYLRHNKVVGQEAESLYMQHSDRPLKILDYKSSRGDKADLEQAKSLLTSTQLERLKIVSEIKDAQSALSLLELTSKVASFALKQSAAKSDSSLNAWVERIEHIQIAQKNIAANGNIKANLDTLVINL